MSQVRELSLPETPVHELFELQASAAPESTALHFGDIELSYGQLNGRANQLARALAARGIGRDDRVIVCVDPGFEIVIALLALLKLGAVYVPLDPSYPEARIRAIIDDTEPRLVLTQSAIASRLPFAPVETLALDLPLAELSSQASDNLSLAIEPSQTAYVYYTSGTTGVPKGVMASHANLASYLGSAHRRYRFSSADVGLALARFSFSISMFELLSPLIVGGRLILVERAQVLDFARLSETLQRATFFHAGPSLLRGLLAYLERQHRDLSVFAGMRHASSGGDMVPVEVLEALRRVFTNAEVFVIYGCSEISCMGTTYEVPRDAELERSYVGRAFAGTHVRVVDEALADVPNGVVGEVLFAGPGVVKGYLKRPELTAEKFVELDGQPFYKTGDRGRLSPDGLLELVGRSDFQVKIGGIRIELGEIEHHLRRAPGVTSAVVSAKQLEGETTLVAYVVLEDVDRRASAARAADLRRHLLQQLPDYMVPAVYVELAALPLNHNLKVDRRALPDPPRVSESAEKVGAEAQLREIWRQLLRVEEVAPGDNFFELGGTSLLALQLVQQVDTKLGVSLSGLEILREPFGVQARLCGERLGGASPRAASATANESLEPFYFGPEQTLYGVLHGAQVARAERAVLICAPLGHEHLRAHFVLRRLAQRLASAGAPTLLFHYYGCGDSLGDAGTASLARYRADIAAAQGELARRTGAKQLSAVGVRLGATLLATAATETSFDKLVLWDPITHGAEHRATLERADLAYRRSLALFSFRRRLGRLLERAPRELLGAPYSGRALRELEGLVLPTAAPLRKTFTSRCDWLDLARLEEMLPDVGISETLSRLLLEAE